jgi:signal transduction histidine kinase
MRSTLSGAKAFLGKALASGDGGAADSLYIDNSRRLTDLFVIMQAHLPANALPSAATILREINGSEKTLNEAIRGAARSIERALKITHLMVDYSRAGRHQPGRARCEISGAVLAVLRDAEVDLEAQRITVEVNIAEGCAISCDEAHLDAILKNLIVNARDALTDTDAPEGRRLAVSAASEPDGTVEIRVEDTGIGIPPDHLSDIFEPFFSTKPEAGTGLGLSVVQKLVWLYEGTITIESEVGRGTIARVRFPPRR